MNVRRFVASTAMLLLLASPALAQPAPTTAPPPVLGSTSGLSADSSRSPIGFTPPTPANIGDYVKAVGGIEVSAAFHSTKEVSASVPVNLGPLHTSVNAVKLENGADVSLQASYSRKNGQPEATLDGITLNAKGVDLGPQIGGLGLKFTSAQIHADGSMTVKLNSWMPEFKMDSLQKLPNGDMQFKGANFYSPDITIAKNGDVKIGKDVKVFGHKLFGVQKTIGHLDPQLVAQMGWPPKLEALLAVAAAPGAKSSKPNPLAGTISQLAGGLSWDVKANADGLPITVEGAKIKAKESVHLHGAANLKNGEISSVGSSNTANLTINFDKQSLGDAKNGIDLQKGSMTLDGAYKLDVPLDGGKQMSVAFDGSASYSVDGTNLHLTLPNGGKVSVGQLDLERSGAVHFAMKGADKSFKLDDAHYTLDAKGPVHIEKLGPISSMDLDGELRSSGLSKISATGLLALNGNLGGSVEIRNGGTLNRLAGNPGFYASTFKPGSRVDVKLDELFAAVQLPLDGKPAGFQGADARGTVGLHGDVTGVTINKNGVNVTAPDAHVDLTTTGAVKVRGTNVTGSGNVTGELGLPNGATVNASVGNVKASTTIDPGSHVDLNANVSRTDGAAQPELVVTTGNLNGRETPAANGKILRVVPKGTTLTVLKRQTDWAQVKAADGASFWVSTKFVATSRPASTGSPVTNVSGKITGELGATNATVDAFGAKGDVKAHVTAGINAPFKATIGSDGVPHIDTKATSATLPIRIDLKKGTKVTFKGNTVTLTDDVCYVQLTGDIALDGNGKPVLTKLENVDVQLELGAASALLFGKTFTVPDLATTHFKGSVTFAKTGLQVHGDASATIKGTTAPLFDIKF